MPSKPEMFIPATSSVPNALDLLIDKMSSRPKTQQALRRVAQSFNSNIFKEPVFDDFIQVLEALGRPVTTRGAASGDADDVDKEVASTLEDLLENIQNVDSKGAAKALKLFIDEWK